ncbi:MAG: hypothetical protein A2808_04065 [Candidatus Moranbacteria bacterium RIFCSPHIGHO2_01_FULL_55_24]|nr:MAG: hypothetical protein A2808_04065 [Candidatus Moranbacteria bacterium RIFCSPHIGHO2_01_FULL_55_24]
MRIPSLRHKKARGSVLVFSLIVLSFLLISALSVAAVAVSETKTSIAVNRSSVAFQAADSGVEILLEKIYSGSCDSSALSCLGTCSGGEITGNVGSGNYKINFYENDGAHISSCSTTTWRTDVVHLKSEGIYGRTTRAVEVEVKHP